MNTIAAHLKIDFTSFESGLYDSDTFSSKILQLHRKVNECEQFLTVRFIQHKGSPVLQPFTTGAVLNKDKHKYRYIMRL